MYIFFVELLFLLALWKVLQVLFVVVLGYELDEVNIDDVAEAQGFDIVLCTTATNLFFGLHLLS